eukprot:8139066-Pyramimonas_sp.AAC.1
MMRATRETINRAPSTALTARKARARAACPVISNRHTLELRFSSPPLSRRFDVLMARPPSSHIMQCLKDHQ